MHDWSAPCSPSSCTLAPASLLSRRLTLAMTSVNNLFVVGFVVAKISHAAAMGDAGRAVVMDENEEGGDSNTPSKPGGLPKR